MVSNTRELPVIGREEALAEHCAWEARLDVLERTETVDKEALCLARVLSAVDNFGYGFGKIRTGELGQWDVFFAVEECLPSDTRCTEDELLLIAGLTRRQKKKADHRQFLEDNCVNPDNPEEVAIFMAIERMSPQQLDNSLRQFEVSLEEDD